MYKGLKVPSDFESDSCPSQSAQESEFENVLK